MTHLICGDIHFPFHDQQALFGLLTAVRLLQPDRIDLNGDLLDHTCLSHKFLDLPADKRAWTVEYEISLCTAFLNLLRSLAPHASIHYLEGNHEARLTRWLNTRGREIRGVVQPLHRVLTCERLGIEWHPYGQLLRVGGLGVTHGSVIRRQSGSSAASQADQYGCSLVMNHTHRGGVHYFTSSTGTRVAYENFCLCGLNPHYILGTPNWQQGWSHVTHGPKGAFHVEQTPWSSNPKGHFFWRGKWTPTSPPRRWARLIPAPLQW